MAHILLLSVLAAVSASASARESPVAQVITLLTDLQTQVQGEGSTEAAAYDTFACWCKSSTDTKSTSITTGQDNIDTYSADIQADTASQATKEADLEERKVKHSKLGAELTSTVSQCTAETAEFEANVADLTKAITSLEGAITTLNGSRPSLLTIRHKMGGNLASTLAGSLALAEALGIVKAPQLNAVQTFLQQKVDPADPEYKFHSQGIVDILAEMLTDFNNSKTQSETDWQQSNNACSNLTTTITDDMSANDVAMTTLEGEIDTLKSNIATNRQDLVLAETQLKDDQLYLKDVTTRCEKRAREWDQRSSMRANELTAISQALELLEGKVTEMDVVNNRTLLLQRKRPHRVAQVAAAAPERQSNVSIKRHSVSFLQKGSARFLAADSAMTRKREKARSALLKVDAPQLSAIAKRILEDPFFEVKNMIQGLIEKLLNETHADATQKGFCDTEIAKATTDRDYRNAEDAKLDAEVLALEAKRDTLIQEISTAWASANQTADQLAVAVSERNTSRYNNLDTISKAKEGLEAVTEAITILKHFYSSANRARVSLVQAKDSATPAQADVPALGYDGAYKAQQESSEGIIELLEVIKSDFVNTVKTTERSEKEAQEDFTEFDRMSKMSIAEQLKFKELNEQDLERTKNKITQKENDIVTNQEMLNATLQTLADLEPMCNEIIHSYFERELQRQAEIAALNKAICYLDPSKTDEDCESS